MIRYVNLLVSMEYDFTKNRAHTAPPPSACISVSSALSSLKFLDWNHWMCLYPSMDFFRRTCTTKLSTHSQASPLRNARKDLNLGRKNSFYVTSTSKKRMGDKSSFTTEKIVQKNSGRSQGFVQNIVRIVSSMGIQKWRKPKKKIWSLSKWQNFWEKRQRHAPRYSCLEKN